MISVLFHEPNVTLTIFSVHDQYPLFMVGLTYCKWDFLKVLFRHGSVTLDFSINTSFPVNKSPANLMNQIVSVYIRHSIYNYNNFRFSVYISMDPVVRSHRLCWHNNASNKLVGRAWLWGEAVTLNSFEVKPLVKLVFRPLQTIAVAPGSATMIQDAIPWLPINKITVWPCKLFVVRSSTRCEKLMIKYLCWNYI